MGDSQITYIVLLFAAFHANIYVQIWLSDKMQELPYWLHSKREKITLEKAKKASIEIKYWQAALYLLSYYATLPVLSILEGVFLYRCNFKYINSWIVNIAIIIFWTIQLLENYFICHRYSQDCIVLKFNESKAVNAVFVILGLLCFVV